MKRTLIKTSGSEIINFNLDNQLNLNEANVIEKIKKNSVFFKSIILPRDHLMNNFSIKGILKGHEADGFSDLLKTNGVTLAFLRDETRSSFSDIWTKRTQEGWYGALTGKEYYQYLDQLEENIDGFQYVTINSSERQHMMSQILTKYYKQQQEQLFCGNEQNYYSTNENSDFDILHEFCENPKPISRSEAYTRYFSIPGVGFQDFQHMSDSKKKIKELIDTSHGLSLAKQLGVNIEYVDDSKPLILSDSQRDDIHIENYEKEIICPDFNALRFKEIAYIREKSEFEEYKTTYLELLEEIRIERDETKLEELISFLSDYLVAITNDDCIKRYRKKTYLRTYNTYYECNSLKLTANMISLEPLKGKPHETIWNLILDAGIFENDGIERNISKKVESTCNTLDTGIGR